MLILNVIKSQSLRIWGPALVVGSFFLLFQEGAHSQTPDASGLQIAASVDIVGQAGDAAPGTPNRLEVREAEVMLSAPADFAFDGVLSMAAHEEGGEFLFEVHEAFLGSSKLIPRSRFRVGKFFLGFGRLNQFHRHDWPFISAPIVHREFFDEEAVADTGAEFSYLTPLPFFLELTGGVTNGWTFGHAHSLGEAPHFPTHYLRVASFTDLPWDGGFQPAFSIVGRKPTDGSKIYHYGMDLTAKWRESNILRGFFQSEVWYRTIQRGGFPTDRTLGFYVYPQYGFNSSLRFGTRLDFLTVLSLRGTNSGERVSNGRLALVPTLTYAVSEFTTFRGAYTWENRWKQGTASESESAFEIQSVFILGAHPAHDF